MCVCVRARARKNIFLRYLDQTQAIEIVNKLGGENLILF